MLAEHLQDTSICDNLIKFFHDNPDLQKPGRVSGEPGGPNIVERSTKASTDISMFSSVVEQDQVRYKAVYDYLIALHSIVNHYLDEYPWAGAYSQFGIIENFNIQYYKPNEGYVQWHTERCGANAIYTNRHLVWMTYLNDVTDAGETAFYHQEMKFRPEKGLTLIWPADWTFTHKGITSPTQEKYIITGWLNYFNKSET